MIRHTYVYILVSDMGGFLKIVICVIMHKTQMIGSELKEY